MVRLVVLCILLVLAAAPAASAGEIVVLENRTDASVRTETAQRERALGFAAGRRFTRALRGFAADLTPAQVATLRRDPEVAAVVADRPVRALAAVPLAAGDAVPPGVRRVIAAPQNTVREAASGAVAVLDTGVDLEHPDLDVAAGTTCIGSGAPDDVHGHGTHVAGTIGARNDGAGVAGVAPGTRIVAVKVLDDTGSGTTSSVLCGIEWVIANAAALDIGVANFSLGGTGTRSTCDTDPAHAAYCALADAGVTAVAAAGNAAVDFGATDPAVPAAYPEVLTVAAMTDTDGVAGGLGGACSDPDDHYATFSNFATESADSAHLVAAPGRCIRSTLPGGGYGRMSGTSMAAPHVAALVALCLGEAGTAGPCAGLPPAQIIAHVRASAASSAFTGLSGRDHGPLAQLVVASPSETVTDEPAPAPAEDPTPQDESQPADDSPPAPSVGPAPAPAEQPATTPAPAPVEQPAPVAAPAPPAPIAAPAAEPTRVRARKIRRAPTLIVGRTTLRALLRRGVKVRVRCGTRRCRATVRLRGGGRTLATGRGATLRLRPARMLLHRRALTLHVVAHVRHGTRVVRIVERLKLKR